MPGPNATNVYRQGDGPRAIFLHANGYPPLAYRPFLDALTSGSDGDPLDVTAYATRPLLGHPARRTHWVQLALDVLDTLDEPVIGIGHSMGATALLQAARRHPQAFNALVLIEPAMTHAWQARLLPFIPMWLIDRLGPSGPTRRKRDRWPDADAYRASAKRSGLYDRFSKEAMDALVAAAVAPRGDQVALTFPKAWEAMFFTLAPHPSRDAEATRIPLVALRAASSIFLDDARWNALLRARPDAITRQLAGYGHLLPLEAPEKTARAVVAGLREAKVLRE